MTRGCSREGRSSVLGGARNDPDFTARGLVRSLRRSEDLVLAVLTEQRDLVLLPARGVAKLLTKDPAGPTLDADPLFHRFLTGATVNVPRRLVRVGFHSVALHGSLLVASGAMLALGRHPIR